MNKGKKKKTNVELRRHHGDFGLFDDGLRQIKIWHTFVPHVVDQRRWVLTDQMWTRTKYYHGKFDKQQQHGQQNENRE